jgi:hypothetical protein
MMVSRPNPITPETNDKDVARMTVAWAIVQASNYTAVSYVGHGEEARKAMTQAYIETYNAILANERGETVQET